MTDEQDSFIYLLALVQIDSESTEITMGLAIAYPELYFLGLLHQYCTDIPPTIAQEEYNELWQLAKYLQEKSIKKQPPSSPGT